MHEAGTSPHTTQRTNVAKAATPVDRAMVLAAGRGERMRPLTDARPKPLLEVHGKPLIVWHLEALARDGIRHVVVNTAWLEEQIPAVLGDGSRFGLHIEYSREGRDHGGALETAGGIATARPWARSSESDGGDCYWLVSADIYCPGFRFDAGVAGRFAQSSDLAHLWLVPNPPFHAQGDFTLDAAGRLHRPSGENAASATYANLALCRRGLTQGVAPGKRAALGPLLFDAARAGALSGAMWEGPWENVGTPAQLNALNASAMRATGSGPGMSPGR